MPVTQVIYASRPFGYDELTLAGILGTARHNNTRDGITGALICREDIYLQLLEGPSDRVGAALARIERDDRHTELTVLVSAVVGDRLFPSWAMRHDPARSWLWTAAEVSAGAVRTASADDVRGVFERLAAAPDIDAPTNRSGCPGQPT